MRTVVAIVVYNRVKNIQRWLYCWSQCNYADVQLVVIDNSWSEEIKQLCQNVIYIPRQNQGFDIGAFQDVCRKRLPGFPDYDYLLWCCDDTFPMTRNFVHYFIDKFNPRVGLTCMKISLSVQAHVRTSGFCISRQLAEQIVFPSDPVITKKDCYLFEHRGPNTLTNQVRRLGLSCEQVRPDKTAPLWDSGYHKRLDRFKEHQEVFPFKDHDLVVFISTIYNTYPQIISSLILQTHKNWKLILIHDGPNETGLKALINDNRIHFIETKQRLNAFGHPLRQMALNDLELGDFVVVTNADNYYVPVFIEYMLRGFDQSEDAVATYCDKMTHSYKAWDVIPCRLERGYLDCGGVMVKSSVAKQVGWQNTQDHSADWIYFCEIANRYGWKNFIPVKGNLFVHN